ncbi:MAG: HAD family hydrolase [Kouleothrix sp.]
MSYDVILFDLDDTLYDLRSYWCMRLHEMFESLLAAYPHFERDSLVRQAIAEKVYIEKLPLFLRSLGISDERQINAAQALFARDWFARLVLYDDAAAMLQALRPHFKLGLVTNGPSRTQRPKIEQFDLDAYLDLLIVSEEVGIAKPDPAIFQLAIARLGSSADRALYVGDLLEFDLPGAAAAGMAFVWMNPRREALPEHLPRPLATIERLIDLPRLLL